MWKSVLGGRIRFAFSRVQTEEILLHMEALLEHWSKTYNGMGNMHILIEGERGSMVLGVWWLRMNRDHLGQVVEKVKIEMEHNAGVVFLDHSLREDKTWWGLWHFQEGLLGVVQIICHGMRTLILT